MSIEWRQSGLGYISELDGVGIFVFSNYCEEEGYWGWHCISKGNYFVCPNSNRGAGYKTFDTAARAAIRTARKIAKTEWM